MKKILLLLSIVVITLSYSQNTGVVLGSNYIPNIDISTNQSPLPIPQDYFGQPIGLPNQDPTVGYIGQLSTNVSNIQMNSDGEILFFIVDDFIYDKDGYFIDRLETNGTQPFVKGASEICIIPDAFNCGQYYIITTHVDEHKKTPVIYKLDMTAPNIHDPNFTCEYYGALIGPDGTSGSYNDVPGGFTGAHIGGEVYEPFFPDDITPDKQSGVFFGATKLRSDDTRLFFITNGHGLYSFLLSSTGFEYISYFDFNQSIYNPSEVRSELEVVLLSNGNYRVAAPYRANGFSNSNEGLFTAEYTPNGNIIQNTIRTFTVQAEIGNSSLNSHLRGIEFSNDGRYLYVTHTTNSLELNAFEYFDFLNPTSDLQPINLLNGIDFQYSFLELSFNNQLIIPNEDGLYAMDASNPNSSITLLNSFTNSPNYEYDSQPIPTVMKAYLIQDQIDNMDYNAHFTAISGCCAKLKNYDKRTYTAQNTETWEDNAIGSNPFLSTTGNTVLIKKELIIPAGITVTIKDMIIKFAPTARVIIENGNGETNGGALILNNSTFTIDEGCGNDDLWFGVEVWGNQNNEQSFSQGKVSLINNSRIEHARIGILASKRNFIFDSLDICEDNPIFLPNAFDDTRNGGVIYTSNSTLYNNPRSVYFRPYISPTHMNNQSNFITTHFIWDGYLNGSHPVYVHSSLEEVKGVSFHGCDFNNLTPQLYSFNDLGTGIISRNSQFYVSSKCNVSQQVGQSCSNETRSLFSNLRTGIYSSSSNSLTFSCENSDFINTQYGIFVNGTSKEKITQNYFEIKEGDYFQSVGIYLIFSTSYTVQENNLTNHLNPLTAQPNTYGIVVKNSGKYENLIYKNQFSNLLIGGQTEGLNGTYYIPTNGILPKISGLVWKCNRFVDNIEKYDLALMNNGEIKINQGDNSLNSPSYIVAKKKGANNFFSQHHESPLINHDLYVDATSSGYTYFHNLVNELTPDSYSSTVTPIVNQYPLGSPIKDSNYICPSKLGGKTKIQLIAKVDNLETRINNNKQRIAYGDRAHLYNVIANGNNWHKRVDLLNASPFLSDSVMITYIESQPPFGHLKQVMIANSPLTNPVLLALQNANLPNGVLNQIQNAQNGISARERKIAKINRLTSRRELIFDDLTKLFLLDTTQNAGASMPWLISILENENTVKSKTLLFKIYLSAKDSLNAASVKQDLATMGVSSKFLDLANLEMQFVKEASTCKAVHSNPVLESQLANIRLNTQDKKVGNDAGCILDMNATPFIPPVYVESSAIMLNDQEEEQEEEKIDLTSSSSYVMYPNPANNRVTFDFSSNEDGEMRIDFYDLSGKLMLTHISEFTNIEQVDVSDLQKGVYIVKIQIDNVQVGVENLVIKR